VDRSGLLCLNNLHLIGSLEQFAIPPLLLAGVLMSGPVQRVYKISSLESARPLAQVDLKTLELLPYPADAAGLPIGAGSLPARSLPQTRRLLRTLNRIVAEADADAFLAMTDRAWRLGSDPWDDGPITGGGALSLSLFRLLELLEACLQTDPVPVVENPYRLPRRRSPRPPRADQLPGATLQMLIDRALEHIFELPADATD
jgi:hypothetical protein